MQSPDLIPVQYVGKRERYTDGTYGTRIEWTQGQVQLVPADKAKLLLRHPDVYVRAEDAEAAPVAEVAPEPEKKDDEPEQELRDAIRFMDKAGLEQYAKTNFQVDLDKRKGVETLRSQVMGLIDQYGAP